jgi:hypothetical protein
MIPDNNQYSMVVWRGWRVETWRHMEVRVVVVVDEWIHES